MKPAGAPVLPVEKQKETKRTKTGLFARWLFGAVPAYRRAKAAFTE
jgi:hypothetical protein